MPLFISFLILVLAGSAQAAFFQADLPSSNPTPSLGVHLVVTGKGLEVGDQWLRAGHTQLLVFKDRKNHGTLRFIGAIENANSLTMLKNWGYQNIQVFETTFTGPRLVNLLLKNPKITSIDMIGHNGAILGFALENYDHRFFTKDVKALAPLAAKMSPDAYVRMMGCNTGWNLTPLLAQTLRVPVSGSFTFADIERLHSDRNWYYHDAGRFPVTGNFVNYNDISFSSPVQCQYHGGCLRLKPVRINYQGRHGSYAGTVPFLKYFCGPVPASDCYRRMALSVTYLVGNEPVSEIPTPTQYARLVAEHMCPSYVNTQKREECYRAVINHMAGVRSLPATYTTSSGPTLNCDFQKCATKMDCSSGSCVMVGEISRAGSTTFVDELNAYVAGYKLLAPF